MAADKLFILYSNKKLVKGVFWCTDDEYAIGFWKFPKLKMADPIQRPKCFLFYVLKKNSTRGFLGALFTIFVSNFCHLKIKNAGPSMAADELFILYSDEKLVKGFLGALITNLSSDF